MTTTTLQTTSFAEALIAAERSGEIPETDDLYGRFVGSWGIEVFDYQRDGTVMKNSGEVHFSRVLEGRAMQLVWAIPCRRERGAQLPKAGNRYGTTLCVWDPEIRAWRVTWINPVSGIRTELVARSSGARIVQIGRHADGTPVRWNFSEITERSFRWTGEALAADGETWNLEVEFRATRQMQ
jgi:hypothetical protein